MGQEGKRAEAPAACLIYTKDSSAVLKEPILHFGQFVANQMPLSAKGQRRRAWTLTIYESDIQEIDYQDAIEDLPCLWKTALWGGYQDRRALRRLKKLLPLTLSDVIAEGHWKFGTGTHIKAEQSKSKGKFNPAPSLAGKSILETDDLDTFFFVPDEILRPLSQERQYIRRGKSAIDLLFAPHILVSATHAMYSDKDFIIPDAKVGIAASRKDADYLKTTAFYFNSIVARYAP